MAVAVKIKSKVFARRFEDEEVPRMNKTEGTVSGIVAVLVAAVILGVFYLGSQIAHENNLKSREYNDKCLVAGKSIVDGDCLPVYQDAPAK